MVSGAGTDEGYSQDIPVRVSHLETSVSQLHIDSQRTQNTLAGIVARQDDQSRILTDISSKLDDTRTQKPNLGVGIAVLVGILGLVATIGTLSFSPVYRDLNNFGAFEIATTDELADRAKIIISSAARLDHVEDRQRATEQRLLIVESNRFTLQDAQVLEAELRRELDALRKRVDIGRDPPP